MLPKTSIAEAGSPSPLLFHVEILNRSALLQEAKTSSLNNETIFTFPSSNRGASAIRQDS
jgi:hypothetical protein